MDPIDNPDSGLFKTDCLIAPDPCSEQLFDRQKYIEDRKWSAEMWILIFK